MLCRGPVVHIGKEGSEDGRLLIKGEREREREHFIRIPSQPVFINSDTQLL